MLVCVYYYIVIMYHNLTIFLLVDMPYIPSFMQSTTLYLSLACRQEVEDKVKSIKLTLRSLLIKYTEDIIMGA